MTSVISLTIEGKSFTITRHAFGWSWTHWSNAELLGLIAESQVDFPKPGEALDDLLEYAEGLD